MNELEECGMGKLKYKWDMIRNVDEARMRAYLFVNRMPANSIFKTSEQFLYHRPQSGIISLEKENKCFKKWLFNLIDYFTKMRKEEADADE